MSGLTVEELKAVGEQWKHDCPGLSGLADTGIVDRDARAGLIKALGIAQFSGDFLSLHDNVKWQQDVEKLRKALRQAEPF